MSDHPPATAAEPSEAELPAEPPAGEADPWLREATRCPACRGRLTYAGEAACEGCGARYRVPRGVPFLVRDFRYDSVKLGVIDYINHTRDPWQLFTRGIEPYTCEFILRGLDASRRVLDLGGGPGFYADFLARNGKTPVVCDLAKHFVLKGSAMFPRIPFLLGDATDLPLADGSVDGVLCLRNLIYVRDLPRALREIRRVLAPGGQFCLVDRNRWSPLHQWRYRRGLYNATIGEFEHYFTLHRLLRDLDGAGLRVRRILGDHLCLPGLFPIPSQQRPGARRALSRLAARILPRFSFYLVLHAERRD